MKGDVCVSEREGAGKIVKFSTSQQFFVSPLIFRCVKTRFINLSELLSTIFFCVVLLGGGGHNHHQKE